MLESGKSKAKGGAPVMLATDYTILALPLLTIGLFVGPSLLALGGIGNRWTWFGLATLALILSMGSCLSSWSVAMSPQQNEGLQNVGVTGIVASSFFIIAFVGCLLAGFFYREKRKSQS